MRAFKHLRTRLLVYMLAVVFLLTAAVLVLVQGRMRHHIRQDLISTLQSQSTVYAHIQEARRAEALAAAQLVAQQPSLKALMSTNHQPTVQDGSQEILGTSGADLLILENAEGRILGFQSRLPELSASVVASLLQSSSGPQDWWAVRGHLLDVSFAPIEAGAQATTRELGRIVLGREISAGAVRGTGAFRNMEFAFLQKGSVVLSSLGPAAGSDLERDIQRVEPAQAIRDVDLRGEHYLAEAVELAGEHPLVLCSLQSYDQATTFLTSLNRLLLLLGAAAVLTAGLIGFFVSRQITRPLERLVRGTRKLEKGDFEFQVAAKGRDEVAQLTRAFEHMRSSLRQSRENMLRSARLEAVGRLAGGVAHDFNNLVMIIQGYSDLLLDSATPEARPFLEEIKKAGGRASGLTRQLLAFSRKQVLEPQVLDPNQTVQGMAKMLRVLIGEDIELVTNFSSQVGRVLVDPGQLEQVIMNLAVNARDAMPDGGKLVIETQTCQLDGSNGGGPAEAAPGVYVLIAVTDTGCGMSKETLAHIFEPFFTTKDAGKGTGLGLATVYGIVKQSRGHISVYSEPGVGTTFKVYLPELDRAVPVSSAKPADTAVKGSGTILLVEDETPVRTLTAEALHRMGYRVLQAGNGIEALAIADQHPEIEVVVTDVVMPRLGGRDLVGKLKQKRDTFGVIFISGYTETAALEHASIGSDAVLLNKPFSAEVLAGKISQVQQGVKQSK